MAHGDITHLEIPVDDIPRAKTFYGAVFNWNIEDYPGYEDYPMWQAPNQISGGALAPRSAEFSEPRSVIEVDSIDDTLSVIEASGGRTVMPKSPIDETSWWAIFEDTEGNQLGLHERTG